MESSLPFTPRSINTPTSVVHLEYAPESLLPVPSTAWTRFVCISDTHTRSFAVPDGDVLLHSGDLTNTGLLSEFQTTIDWICSLPHKVKIIIAGNHDLTLHSEWYDYAHTRFHRGLEKQDVAPILKLLTGPQAQAAGLVYLQDASHEFRIRPDGRKWSVYGSPWSPYFLDWAFNYRRAHGKALIAEFPKTDILLTHGPPSRIFDVTRGNNHVGCEDLRDRLPYLRPRLHVFGHIHEAHGAHAHSWGQLNPQAEPPAIQNEHNMAGDEVGPVEMSLEDSSNSTDVVDGDQTVFVNAATWPAGRGAWRGIHRVPFGGPGFQAVVVDLLD